MGVLGGGERMRAVLLLLPNDLVINNFSHNIIYLSHESVKTIYFLSIAPSV